jgi:acetyl esterase/lipase
MFRLKGKTLLAPIWLNLILLTNDCYGQSVDVLQKKGDSLHHAKQFSRAAQIFSAASRKISPSQSGLLFRSQLSATRCWTLANVKDSAFLQLENMSKALAIGYTDLMAITSEPELIPLHNDIRWWNLTSELFQSVTKRSLTLIDSSYFVNEIIYGRKDGMALTMLSLRPKSAANGKAIIMIRSGGWGSSYYMPGTSEAIPYIKRGYTVFIVFHGSEPVYTIPDAINDLQRAVRYVRYHANSFAIDPDKIGAYGASAAGHLALMCGLADTSATANSPDQIDRMSSKVNAVVSLFPVSDFINWDGAGNNAYSAFLFKESLVHVLEFRQWNTQRRRFTYVNEVKEINAILAQISPICHVSSNDAPVLLFHGDADALVPVRQSEILATKLQTAKVPVFFSVKKGGGHGWPLSEAEVKLIFDWFAKHLN